MDNPSADALSPHATTRRLLARLTAALRRAGWTENEAWDEEDEGKELPVVLEFSRSNFHIQVDWNPATASLTVDDPTESWEWDSALPPLFPLDEPLIIDLSAHPIQAAKAEAARRCFAEAGLLDATRIRLSEDAKALRHDVVMLLWADHVLGAISRHRNGDDGNEAIRALGEEFSWRAAAGLRTYPVIVPDPIPSAAARGIAEWCWRRESDVEEWHFKIGDITMARANIAATRAVLPHVHPEGIDWPGIRLALTAPGRRLADGQTLADIFEEGWTPILTSVHRQIGLWQQADESLGPEAVLRLLTIHGSRSESIGQWWGSGWYETAVRRAVARAAASGALPAAILAVFTDAEHFADTAAGHPDVLDDDTLVWITRAIHKEECLLRDAQLPVPTAVTLPSWAALDLLDILHSTGEEVPDA
ncbi:hypothetical protein OG455_10505 [Kitasatospora sp. NBC_01287]|uniref:hypothetical protein n=1 Tax=Kitasatospora sp. NBC_01287 TaxID=2903573 RepID=UPI002252ACA7|nr:hypothetical protein [Kitasatospora sp. NBC_01287]MCX4745951.1 hypothetical protein [Kitasatospora sp. NBC_01287]